LGYLALGFISNKVAAIAGTKAVCATVIRLQASRRGFPHRDEMGSRGQLDSAHRGATATICYAKLDRRELRLPRRIL